MTTSAYKDCVSGQAWRSDKKESTHIHVKPGRLCSTLYTLCKVTHCTQRHWPLSSRRVPISDHSLHPFEQPSAASRKPFYTRSFGPARFRWSRNQLHRPDAHARAYAYATRRQRIGTRGRLNSAAMDYYAPRCGQNHAVTQAMISCIMSTRADTGESGTNTEDKQ